MTTITLPKLSGYERCTWALKSPERKRYMHTWRLMLNEVYVEMLNVHECLIQDSLGVYHQEVTNYTNG